LKKEIEDLKKRNDKLIFVAKQGHVGAARTTTTTSQPVLANIDNKENPK